jgi:hypothetical protein
LNDFRIVKKIGKTKLSCHLLFSFIGEGAFSQVYRVIRISDNIEYALKQVRIFAFNLVRSKWRSLLIKKNRMH